MAESCTFEKIGSRGVQRATIRDRRKYSPTALGVKHCKRLYRALLLPLDEIEDKRRDLWSRDRDAMGWRFIVPEFLSESYGDLDDETSNPLEQHHDDCHLGKDSSAFQAPDLGLGKDTEIILCSGIGPF